MRRSLAAMTWPFLLTATEVMFAFSGAQQRSDAVPAESVPQDDPVVVLAGDDGPVVREKGHAGADGRELAGPGAAVASW